MVAVLSIGLFATIQRIDFQVKRDREEEMIHRGTQYARAVGKYFRAFGRYPTSIEQLENTNNQRFLRKRYKDPMNRDPKTGQARDFKLLHLTDVQMSLGGAMPGAATAPNTNPDPESPGALNGDNADATGSGPSSIATQAGASSDNADATQGNQNSAGSPPPPQPLSQQAGANGAPQVFGGGGIVGVASFNKDKTIREFNKKNHYNQWQFIYDPTTSIGLITTPNQPPRMLNNTNPLQQPSKPLPGPINPSTPNQGMSNQQ